MFLKFADLARIVRAYRSKSTHASAATLQNAFLLWRRVEKGKPYDVVRELIDA